MIRIKNKNDKLVFVFLTMILSSFTLILKANIYVNNEFPYTTSNDTIPGTITLVDTTTVYDPITNEEKVVVIKHERPIDESLKTLKYSGKTFQEIDTTTTFNVETYIGTSIEYSYKLPIELKGIRNEVSHEGYLKIVEVYGTDKKKRKIIID